jgi:hypothetical protein
VWRLPLTDWVRFAAEADHVAAATAAAARRNRNDRWR